MLKKLRKLAFSRVFVVGIFIILQFLMIFTAALEFTKYFVVYYAVSFSVAFVFVLWIINTRQRMAYKYAWTVVIFIFPAFGVPIYLIFCGSRFSPRSHKINRQIGVSTKAELEANLAKFYAKNPREGRKFGAPPEGKALTDLPQELQDTIKQEKTILREEKDAINQAFNKKWIQKAQEADARRRETPYEKTVREWKERKEKN